MHQSTRTMLFRGFLPAALLALAACGDSTGPDPRSFFGNPVQLGGGSARTYITVDRNGTPVELGVALSESALTGLPAGSGEHEYVLRLPSRGNTTPFDHVYMGWNPQGHEPNGIYTVPHFDFHFYTTSVAEREAITPSDPAFNEKAARKPAPEFVPAGYVMIPGAVPQMGAHWVDPTSPELNGHPFTKTFIYGSWNGRMTFMEPMITKAYLESKPDVTEPIKTASRYDPAGMYPSSYTVRYDASSREYRIALSGFVSRS